MHVTDEDLDSIPGWFDAIDRDLFRWFLGIARNITGAGNLVELGVFMGQSAALVGSYLQSNEELTVIDLFESEAGDTANHSEISLSYPGLSRQAFESNYARIHAELPRVVQDFSERIVDHVAESSCRFMHVDASHLFEHVVLDVLAAQRLLTPSGIVVFDDYRASHTPGVAAAVWAAVANAGLHPIVLSPNKLYATWGDPRPYVDGIERKTPRWRSEVQSVAGSHLLVLFPTYVESYRWIKYLPPAVVPHAKRARARVASWTGR